MKSGGEGGIRTHGTGDRTLDFESSTFDHSVTSPSGVFYGKAKIKSNKQSVVTALQSLKHRTHREIPVNTTAVVFRHAGLRVDEQSFVSVMHVLRQINFRRQCRQIPRAGDETTIRVPEFNPYQL